MKVAEFGFNLRGDDERQVTVGGGGTACSFSIAHDILMHAPGALLRGALLRPATPRLLPTNAHMHTCFTTPTRRQSTSLTPHCSYRCS